MRLFLSKICLLLLGLLVRAQSEGQAQDSLDYIYVRYSPIEHVSVRAEKDPRSGDFYRHMWVSRIPLQHPSNTWLLQARSPAAGKGLALPLALAEGLKQGKINAFHPSNLHKPYRFFDLAGDLCRLSGMETPGTLYWDQIGPDRLCHYLDFLYDKGYSAELARPFSRPLFLRLVWHDPGQALGPVVLAVLPYAGIASFLEALTCEMPGLGQRTIEESLRLRIFEAREIPIARDPARYPLLRP